MVGVDCGEKRLGKTLSPPRVEPCLARKVKHLAIKEVGIKFRECCRRVRENNIERKRRKKTRPGMEASWGSISIWYCDAKIRKTTTTSFDDVLNLDRVGLGF